MINERMMQASPYVPYDPQNYVFTQSEGQVITPVGSGGLHPFEYEGWWNECLTWHESCYIHAGLNPTTTYRVKGPDALKFFSDICVNSFENFPVGKGKHGIMCNENGKIMQDGLLLRVGEDEFLTYWMWPYAEYALKKGNYDAVGENLTGKVFLYQLGGPKSLEILEKATGESLRDIEFIHFRDSNIAGKKVSIVRVGMAGSLAYEVHGEVEDAISVYNAILESGEPLGLKKIGRNAYWNTHTECGFPQLTIHFIFAHDPEFEKFLGGTDIWGSMAVPLKGSAGQEVSLRFRSPYEVGWGRMVKFDHDFVGRAALEKEHQNLNKKMVTLIWNDEDIMDIIHSKFGPDEPYQDMELVGDFSYSYGHAGIPSDLVLIGEKQVGISSGRMFSSYYRQVISLCTIDSDIEEGIEVKVLWGDSGTRQKKIRAIVSRFPYLNENRNENVDVKKI